MFFSGLEIEPAPAQPAPLLPASRKKILTVRGERSERPVAVPTAPAKLIKPGHAGLRHRGPTVRPWGNRCHRRTEPAHRGSAPTTALVAGTTPDEPALEVVRMRAWWC